MLNVNAQPLWSNIEELPPKVWSLFASTGGRPRDIETILLSMASPRDRQVAPVNDLERVREDRLMQELCRIDPAGQDATFCRYLLPSMLGLQFLVKDGLEVTRFGLDVASRALLNADLLSAATPATTPAVSFATPAVSLRFAERLPGSLQSVFVRLVADTTFYERRGDGKDFEHIWVQLLQTHLMLQYRVRVGGDRIHFWPRDDTVVPLGGPARPTGAALAMFAGTDVRESALFDEPDKKRIFEARDSTIVRSLVFDPTAEPIVMVWHDLWTPRVQGAANDPLKLGRAATLEVAWESPALVYFSLPTHEAIDFMLLVDGCRKEPQPCLFLRTGFMVV
jgi:hypothetical protein